MRWWSWVAARLAWRWACTWPSTATPSPCWRWALSCPLRASQSTSAPCSSAPGETQEGFTHHLNARVTAIHPNGVTYEDADGKGYTISAQSVVLAAGMKARQEEAMAFMDGTVRTHMIGDCDKVGCVQTGLRAALLWRIISEQVLHCATSFSC